MDFEYLSRMKGLVSLYTNKKSTNLLEGEFRSIFRGRSLDFDELREYAYGDNIKDIDWKSSSRAGKILTRQYVAEKKHNILFICDTGTKMQGDTPEGEAKADVALTSLGTIAFFTERHGDDFALIQSTEKGYDFSMFRGGTVHFETIMNNYRVNVEKEGTKTLDQIMNYVSDRIHRRMVVFVITDIDGISRIGERLLRKITVDNDLLIVNVEDAYLSGNTVYDLDAEAYEDDFVLGSSVLCEAERAKRREILGRAENLFKQYHVSMVTVSSEAEIVEKTIELFERHNHENFG
jgi:uncharacterized protein (DUF58 family)